MLRIIYLQAIAEESTWHPAVRAYQMQRVSLESNPSAQTQLLEIRLNNRSRSRALPCRLFLRL